MRAFFVAAVIFASAAGDRAPAQPGLPQIVKAAIEQSRQDCSGRSELKPGFIETRDINADGRADYILDYGHFQCGDNAGYFCGTGGCLTQVFTSLPDGTYVEALNENVRGLQFASVGGRPAMLLSLHGSACGRAGYEPCAMTLYWNGLRFSPAN